MAVKRRAAGRGASSAKFFKRFLAAELVTLFIKNGTWIPAAPPPKVLIISCAYLWLGRITWSGPMTSSSKASPPSYNNRLPAIKAAAGGVAFNAKEGNDLGGLRKVRAATAFAACVPAVTLGAVFRNSPRPLRSKEPGSALLKKADTASSVLKKAFRCWGLKSRIGTCVSTPLGSNTGNV